MQKRRITIKNKLGLHARAAAKFVACASQFTSEISVCREQRCVNGKSIMGVMMLAASKGTELEISASGDDALTALDAIEALVDNLFEEAE